MAKATAESIAAVLTVPERILLFCLASDTDWQAASVTHATAQHMMVRGRRANMPKPSRQCTFEYPAEHRSRLLAEAPRDSRAHGPAAR